ncbi:MAG TPA: ferritin-like domain-containing protein [Gammaproteobacteria bacterium]|nr:ferritin-like domain-containing protein [Gammaproteobacteria bacterium]
MAGSSDTYHEPLEKLSSTTQDMHRALVSLQEELEAVDWYQQRADACEDTELRAILIHNMREEIEHAAMVLEWLRRRHPDFERHLRTYLFQQKPIMEIEAIDTAINGNATPSAGIPHGNRLTVGTMQGA